jgi:hypothetical protein
MLKLAIKKVAPGIRGNVCAQRLEVTETGHHCGVSVSGKTRRGWTR